MDRARVMALFNRKPRIGTLSTSDHSGNVNVAVFGSPQMIDEDTVVMGIGNNRSLQYLKQNPKAVFIVMEPGETMADWVGARVYLEAMTIEHSGAFYQSVLEDIVKTAGEAARGMIVAAIRFRITAVRPIVDPG
jgi:hypothetical protein